MICEMFRELVFDYLGGQLDADSLGDFRRHFGACAECSAALRTLEAQETMLAALPRPKAPDTLWGRIRRELADRDLLARLDHSRFRFFGWTAAAAAVLLVTVLALASGPAPADPGLTIEVIDVAQPGATALGRMVPGYENPVPSTPMLDTFLGAR